MNRFYIGQIVLVIMPALTSQYDGKYYPEERFYAAIHNPDAYCWISGLPGTEVINTNGISHVDTDWVHPVTLDPNQ